MLLIIDLSSPHGASVNDFVGPEHSSLTYISVDEAAAGPGTQLAKLDISEAYRIVPVHPCHSVLLGMEWHQNCYLDCCLPFGLRSAPKLFNAVAIHWNGLCVTRTATMWSLQSITWMIFSLQVKPIQQSLDLALSICGELGIPIMPE